MIIISPNSRPLRNGITPNPKDYPYWDRLIELILEKHPRQTIIQIGVTGEKELKNTKIMFNLKLKELRNLLNICDTWISVDNFFHHLASLVGKKGIVLFGPSDPLIFGDSNNINLLKDRKNLRKEQFEWYEKTTHNPDIFVEPEEVLKFI